MLASPDGRLRAPEAWAGFQLFGAAAGGVARLEPVAPLRRGKAARRTAAPSRSPSSWTAERAP
jgi:hypothetical protein